MKRFLEWSLNCICILALAYVAVAKVREHYESRRPPPPHNANFRFGEHVPLTGVRLTEPRVLLLVLSTSCHYCQASTPFYRRLLDQQKKGGWQAVALFPQPESEASAYFKNHNIPDTTIRQADFDQMRVQATPTLMLLDGSGAMQQEWIGELSAEQQADVARHLGLDPKLVTDAGIAKADDPTPKTETTTWELATAIRGPDPFSVVDVRTREQYAVGHIHGSINIPLRELSGRAIHEVSATHPVFLYCNYIAACQANGAQTTCRIASTLLHNAGFKDVRYVRDNIALLREAQIQID